MQKKYIITAIKTKVMFSLNRIYYCVKKETSHFEMPQKSASVMHGSVLPEGGPRPGEDFCAMAYQPQMPCLN